MTVKIFFGSIILMVTLVVTGFAYWMFPIINSFHTHMGGKPLANPRGSVSDQINAWLAFLPDNNVERAMIIAGVIVGYMVLSLLSALFAMRMRRRREDKAARKEGRVRSLHTYNARRQ